MEQRKIRRTKKAPPPHEVRLIREILRADQAWRDLALFNVAVDTMLRSVDLLKLTVNDVIDSPEGKIKAEIPIQQQKTGKTTLVALTSHSQDALVKWIREAGKLGWDYLFTGLHKSKHKPISRAQ